MNKDLISLEDWSAKDVLYLLDMSVDMKKNKTMITDTLKGKSFGLIFQKPSNRTRVSFEVGIFTQGGNCIYLGPDEINLGKRESTYDVAKTLSRYLDGIVARTHSHSDVVELARHADIPVINGLSDLYHPCQALADMFSIREKFRKLKGLHLAFIGDGNNVCHSLLLAGARLGVHMSVACPPGYEPLPAVVESAQRIAEEEKSDCCIRVLQDPAEAVQGANVIYADVWASMGQEHEREKRLVDFKNYQINDVLAQSADKDYIFMHCLPAHRGEEVTESIIDGPNSIVFDQAENRLHVQKTIIRVLFRPKVVYRDASYKLTSIKEEPGESQQNENAQKPEKDSQSGSKT